jgi:hypothetical protein
MTSSKLAFLNSLKNASGLGPTRGLGSVLPVRYLCLLLLGVTLLCASSRQVAAQTEVFGILYPDIAEPDQCFFDPLVIGNGSQRSFTFDRVHLSYIRGKWSRGYSLGEDIYEEGDRRTIKFYMMGMSKEEIAFPEGMHLAAVTVDPQTEIVMHDVDIQGCGDYAFPGTVLRVVLYLGKSRFPTTYYS